MALMKDASKIPFKGLKAISKFGVIPETIANKLSASAPNAGSGGAAFNQGFVSSVRNLSWGCMQTSDIQSSCSVWTLVEPTADFSPKGG